MPTEPKRLTDLPNIGPTLAGELAKIGVENEKHLKKLGSVDAAVRISFAGRGACYNLLYALEGAIRNVRWHRIPKADRDRIKKKFDEKRGAV
ncbi:MAG: TfoX/Sxy family protein [bacterium]